MGHENPDISRKSPEIEIKLGNGSFSLTYENTMLYTFHEPYRHMGHIAISAVEDERAMYVFESPDLLEQLQEFHYPEFKLAVPSVQDVELYIGYMMSELPDGLS